MLKKVEQNLIIIIISSETNENGFLLTVMQRSSIKRCTHLVGCNEKTVKWFFQLFFMLFKKRNILWFSFQYFDEIDTVFLQKKLWIF